MKTATITLEVSEEMERELINLAKEQKCSVEGVALEFLKKALYDPAATTNPNDLPYEVWLERFRAWVNSHPKIDVEVDDSRETIYEGR
jgi:hypothetical protein